MKDITYRRCQSKEHHIPNRLFRFVIVKRMRLWLLQLFTIGGTGEILLFLNSPVEYPIPILCTVHPARLYRELKDRRKALAIF